MNASVGRVFPVSFSGCSGDLGLVKDAELRQKRWKSHRKDEFERRWVTKGTERERGGCVYTLHSRVGCLQGLLLQSACLVVVLGIFMYRTCREMQVCRFVCMPSCLFLFV